VDVDHPSRIAFQCRWGYPTSLSGIYVVGRSNFGGGRVVDVRAYASASYGNMAFEHVPQGQFRYDDRSE